MGSSRDFGPQRGFDQRRQGLALAQKLFEFVAQPRLDAGGPMVGVFIRICISVAVHTPPWRAAKACHGMAQHLDQGRHARVFPFTPA